MIKINFYICPLIFLLVSMASADVPQLINYQGWFTDGDGNPLNSTVSILFKIYDTETNGNILWSETQSVTVADGIFSVLLGSITQIQTSVFNGDDRYLALKVGSDSEMVPRKRLVSVGYSFCSYNSDKLDGKDGSAFVQSVNNVSPNTSGNVDLVAGSNVSITPDGTKNQITISTSTSSGDNLGDHTATENIKLNGNWLSADGASEGVYVNDDGKVGIQTSAPYFDFHLKRLSGFPTTFGIEWQQPVIGETIKDWFYYTVGGTQMLQRGINMVRVSGSGLRFCTQDEMQSGAITEQMRLSGNGNVGIGITNPQAKLEVHSDQGTAVKGNHSNGNYGYFGSEYFGTYGINNNGNQGWLGGVYTGVYGEGVTGVIGIGNNVGPAIIAKNTSTGDLIQGKSATNTVVFRITNDGTTTTKVLEITGGSDLAEPFDITGSKSITPGMVVAIDPECPGQLRIADKAYDRTVAGCVSGANGINPGLIMQQDGSVADGALPVALSGRVYCRVDASYGSIRPGDLLTTSDTPGHAMKVTDYTRAQGAILGKSMTSLQEGTGLILVLVTLQ